MTKSEVIMLRNYIKGAYGYDKGDESTDAVWFDLLHNYEHQGIMQAVKSHIRSGNRFPPTLSELIAGYEVIVQSFSNDILDLMDRDGYFNDPVGSDPALASWNKDNRKRKAQVWLSIHKMPDWFKMDYQRYEGQIKVKYFASPLRSSTKELAT